MEYNSAGCVVVKDIGFNPQVLLIFVKWRTGVEGWTFPKGGIDTDESAMEAAIRETKEETGLLDFKIICELEQSVYRFKLDKTDSEERVKTVNWFLAVSKSGKLGQLKLSDNESLTHREVAWMDIESAKKLLGFDSDVKLLNAAIGRFNDAG